MESWSTLKGLRKGCLPKGGEAGRGGMRRDAGSHVQEWHYHSLQYPPISTLPMGFAAKSHAIWPVQLGEDLEHLAELAR